MKITKLSLIAALAVGTMVVCNATAQDNTDKGGEKKGGRRGGFPTVEQQMERLTTELKLTDDQKPKVKAALEERNKKMQGIRDLPQDERRSKFQKANDEMGAELKKILTPEQYTKWEQMPRGPRGGKKGDGGEKKDSTEKKN